MASEQDRERIRGYAIEMLKQILDVPEEWSFNIVDAAQELIGALEANRPAPAKPAYKSIVAIDVDGPLHRYTKWKGADVLDGGPTPGAMDAIRSYVEAGLEVHIISSRLNRAEGRVAVHGEILRWLCDAFGLAAGGTLHDALVFSPEKPPAVLTIDDRAFCFRGAFPTPEEVKGFEPFRDYDSLEPKP